MKKDDEKKKEHMILRGSRKYYLPFYLMILLLFGVLFYINYSGGEIDSLHFILVGVFAIIILVSTEIHRLINKYEITNDSLIHTEGIFQKKTRQLHFNAISDVDVHQNFSQQILGFGDVNVHLFSRDSSTALKNVNKPFKVLRFLENKISQVEAKGLGRGK